MRYVSMNAWGSGRQKDPSLNTWLEERPNSPLNLTNPDRRRACGLVAICAGDGITDIDNTTV